MDRRTFVKNTCYGAAGMCLDAQSKAEGQVVLPEPPPIHVHGLRPDTPSPLGMPGLFPGRVVDGVLTLSSPTEQPWIDSNLALVRFERAFVPAQIRLYSFQWLVSGAVEGPSTADYSLAVAEAGAFRADLILDLPKDFQQALARGSADGWTTWRQVKDYIKFDSRRNERPMVPQANVGVVPIPLKTRDSCD